MTSIRFAGTGRELAPTGPRLTGPEKVAVLLLCLGEARGSELMRRLDETEIERITRAMSGLGPIPSDVVESVLGEFAETVATGGLPLDSYESARKMLGAFMPDDKVDAMLRDVKAPARRSDIWDRLNAMDEKALAQHLAAEKVPTVAAILRNLSQEATARVLPLLGEERMLQVLQRMMRVEELPDHAMEQIESALREDVLAAADDGSATAARSRVADIFGKLDPALFEAIAPQLAERAPEDFLAVKKRMFTFRDMTRIEGTDLARVMRGVPGNTVPLALRGAEAPLRDHFLAALPIRSRDMLVEEMDAMGPVRARDVRAAQAAIVDYARELLAGDVIRLSPEGAEDEEEFID